MSTVPAIQVPLPEVHHVRTTLINMASWDRVLRVLVGLLMLLIGSFGWAPGVWSSALLIFGWVPVVTGLAGWCPIYTLLGTGTHRSCRRPPPRSRTA